MKTSKADIIREYGPFPEAAQVGGVSFDGKHVWFASGDRLTTFDPESGKKLRSLDVALTTVTRAYADQRDLPSASGNSRAATLFARVCADCHVGIVAFTRP